MWRADRQGWAARTEHPSQPVWVTGSPQDTDAACAISPVCSPGLDTQLS